MSAWCYPLAWAATLAAQLLHLPYAGQLAGLAILAFLLAEFPNQRRYAQALFLALLAIGLLGVAEAPHPIELFLDAWRRGASYAAFFLALTTLRDAAETSPLVRRCGRHLVAQPPGRRYAALTAGGHVFGIILSYGAIELLAAMVARANDADTATAAPARALRARRMLMAIYRGFCVMNCWSPLNIMTAVVSTAVPAAPMPLLLPIAFVVAVGMAALGWLEDRPVGRPPRHARATGKPAIRRTIGKRAIRRTTGKRAIRRDVTRHAARRVTIPRAFRRDRSLVDPFRHHRPGRAGDAAGRGRQPPRRDFPGDRGHAGGALRRRGVAAGAASPPAGPSDPADARPPAGPLPPAHPRLPRRGDGARRLRLHGLRARRRAARRADWRRCSPGCRRWRCRCWCRWC